MYHKTTKLFYVIIIVTIFFYFTNFIKQVIIFNLKKKNLL